MGTTAHFRRLFEPIRIGSLEVPNRIVNTTHGTALGIDRDVEYLRARARGGAGLLGIHSSEGSAGYAVGPGPEAERPDWDQKALHPLSDAAIAHYDDIAIPGLRRRAEAVHDEGGVCYAQVYHSGAARHATVAAPVIGPSAVADPYEGLVPHPLSAIEIEQLIWAYAHQIRRIADAGLDGAEIHAAHGYLVNQFMSPFANLRTDRWGGSPEHRVRFAVEIIEAARTMVPSDFVIGIRVGADGDGSRRGITVEQLAELSALLAPHVGYISVSGGNYAGFGDGPEPAYVSPWYREPAFNADAAAAVKAVVDVPVIVTGRIADPSIAEGLLADGVADMVGMVRALIADPDLPRKAREGRADTVRMCLGMSECHAIGPHRTPMTCAVNASAGRETELTVRSASRRKKVVVVGAGPAGLEAARVAAERGHEVYLADESRAIGGTPAVLARDDNRRNLRDHAAYFVPELRRLGVELVLGHRVGAQEVIEFGADAVVVATGGSPIVPDVPGIDDDCVVQGLDVLRGQPVSGRVIVVGGLEQHLGPPTIAEHLADSGCDVELVSEHLDFASRVEHGTRLVLAQRLRTKGVRVRQFTRLAAVAGASAELFDTATRTASQHDDVTVVLACGLVPNDALAAELRGEVPDVHLVGDALAPRRMMHATLDGARVGNTL